MAKLMSLMVVLLVALVRSTNAVDCSSVVANILPCSSFLGNSLPLLPGTRCCDAATSVVDKADTERLCQCFRRSPLGSGGVLSSKAQQLPSLCNVSGFRPLVDCLVTSEENKDQLPLVPQTPLPVFPLPPLNPGATPLFPLPPLFPGVPTVGPLPPLIPDIPPLAFPGLPPFGRLPPLITDVPPLAFPGIPPFGPNVPPLAFPGLPPVGPFPPLIPDVPPQASVPPVA